MEGATNFVEDSKGPTQEATQTSPHLEKSREELIADITQLLDNLFESHNIVNNSYLINRAINENFEIPSKVIYGERSIRALTSDREIINKALENTNNITVNKKGDVVFSVQPKNNEFKRKITIKNVPREKRHAFREFVNSLLSQKEEPLTWNFNPQLSIVTLICKDEPTASHLFELLTTTKFDEETLECSLDSENVYHAGVENQKKKTRNFANPMNPMFPYNAYPYPMYPAFFPPTTAPNNFYVTNYYRSMNHFYANVPNPGYVKPIYNSPPTFGKKPYNPNYKNDRKPYAKKGKQFRDKNFKYGNKMSTKSSSVEVNDNEFPPL